MLSFYGLAPRPYIVAVEPEAPASVRVGAILAIPAIATILLGVFPGLVVGIIEEASVLRW